MHKLQQKQFAVRDETGWTEDTDSYQSESARHDDQAIRLSEMA